MSNNFIRVIGAGLAGSEAALRLASFGFKVKLYEMKPKKKTPAQKLDTPAELVCSNSFRSTKSTNAVGLLKEEMLLMNSFLMHLALKAQVPAGDALAVDREVFSKLVLEEINKNSLIDLINEEITEIPNDDIKTIIATGPLTSDPLALDLVKVIGQERLAFYDAIAPIVDASSIDMTKAFKQNRWQEGNSDGDYINCPMDKATYENFICSMLNAEKAKSHDFEKIHYFEGCLPIEIMAERGVNTLRFGPFKPVGLTDPNTGKRPYAVLQLRKEDIFGTSYNLVGCQSKMIISAQKEVFSIIPALKNVKFMRYGSVHRNTYVDSPKVLDDHFRLKNSPNIYLAGQITGVEGYVESIACGLLVSQMIKALFLGQKYRPLPKENALGGLYNHVLGNLMADKKARYVPSNITWAMMPPLENEVENNNVNKKLLLYNRAISSLKEYCGYEKETQESCSYL